MSVALPGAGGLFSEMQDALRHSDKHSVRLNRLIFSALADFRSIADNLSTRPTRLMELVPLAPSNIGACDACRAGMEGV